MAGTTLSDPWNEELSELPPVTVSRQRHGSRVLGALRALMG